MIKNFTPRLYQETILDSCTQRNTLVVLPTGLGKTAIAFLVTAYRLKQYPNSKTLILAPTRPLCQQHVETFKKHLDIEPEKIVLFTGYVKPKEREILWKNAKVIVSTPQTIENDIINNRTPLDDVSLLVVDECHRAVKDYSYVFIARQYYKKSNFPRILGLTASPGSDMEKIQEIIKNLFIEDIEVRTIDDPDVKPYVKEIDISWIKVNLNPFFREIQQYIKKFLEERIKKLKEWNIIKKGSLNSLSKKELLELQSNLRSEIATGKKHTAFWNALSVLAEIMKMQHALELLETQGVTPLYKYLKKLQNEGINTKVKAVRRLIKDINFRSALILTEKLYNQGFEHPKLIELQKIVENELKKNKDIKIIIFNQYRDNALEIREKLNKLPGAKAKIFVGQLKKGETGLTQKEQKQVLDEFRNNLFNILVATSVGEEGLDIPKVDLVIFYEPIPSAVRHIQRKGRTGRQEKGRVIVLMARNTRDEAYRWSAHRKEKKMYYYLKSLKTKLVPVKQSKSQATLKDFFQPNLYIIADFREKGSCVVKHMVEFGINLKLEKLDYADYLLSSRVGVEVKTVEDFVNSILDGRLLPQAKNLKDNFEKPLIIIEGTSDLYTQRNMHPNAIRGALSTIAIDYRIPIIQTKNPLETAQLLMLIAKREQENGYNNLNLHIKKPLTLKEAQEYVVSSFPGIGATLAKPLLKRFKTIKNIINATKEELEQVPKIGPKKVKKLKEVIESEYTTDSEES